MSSRDAFQDGRVLELQLRVARRADELARIMGKGTEHSFELWRHAENELWASLTSPDVDGLAGSAAEGK